MKYRSMVLKTRRRDNIEIEGGLSIRRTSLRTKTGREINISSLEGRLSLETVHEFLSMVRRETSSILILEMSEVAFLDSAAVGALAILFVRRRKGPQKTPLAGLTSRSMATLRVSGLTDLLPIYASADLALRRLLSN